MSKSETRILLVDDSDDDIFLVREAFKESGVAHRLDAISDGEQALSFLKEDGNRPDVVLLDINMPRFSGFDVLEWVQSDPQLREIPIVMLTTSEQPEDVRRATEGGARDYFRKPVEFRHLRDLASRVLDRWGPEDLDRKPEPQAV
ncbi:MAG: response regulator [Phycisphaeraceae bacterium]